MTDRTSLTVVLAAGEGTRMRSSLPKVLHPVAGQPLLAHVLRGRAAWRGNLAGGGGRARSRRGRGRDQAPAAGCCDLRPARAARHRACGAGGARGDRARRRRSARRLRRHAADFGRDLCADARAAGKGRSARRARLSRRRSDRLWPAADAKATGWSRSASRPMPARRSARSRCAMPA